MEIADWRKQIDAMDDEIVALINKRAEAAKAIGVLKQTSELPVYEPQREREVFDHVKRVNPGPLTDEQIVDVYMRIIDVMRVLQRRDL
jgi:chorismate mutase